MSCPLKGIDCVKVTSELFAGLITLSIAAFSVWASHRYQQKRDRERADVEAAERQELERRLAALGVARGAAVRIRNEGEKRSLQGVELFAWLRSMLQAEQAMIDRANEVSDAVGSLVDWQDRTPGLPYTHIQDAGQRRALNNLSGAIARAETVIVMSYRR